jgi:DNA-directed RNA polymerase specialized sigma24 family protein
MSEKKYKRVKRNEAAEFINKVAGQVAKENKRRRALKRELREEALDRIERAVRTQEDFEQLANVWDLHEKNRRRKDDKYLVSLYPRKTDDDTGDDDAVDGIISGDTVFPTPYRHSLHTRYWRQIISGNFLDYIFDCAFAMHETVSSRTLSKAIERLNDNQKEIFYMVAVEEKTPQEIADYRNQTPRNIRKVYKGAIESIHRYLEETAKREKDV